MVVADPLLGLAIQLSTGGLLGFLAGFALKKLAKVLAVILGLFVLGLMVLNYYGVVRVDWSGLIGLGEEALKWIEIRYSSIAAFVLENLPFAGSFLVGFAIGLKIAYTSPIANLGGSILWEPHLGHLLGFLGLSRSLNT